MSEHTINLDRLFDLVGVVCDEDATRGQVEELDTIAVADQEACRRYLGYCRMHDMLRLELCAHRATQAVYEQIGIKPSVTGSSESNVIRTEPPASPALPFLSTTLHNTLSYFSEGMPLAYLLATVITGLGLLIGSLIPASHPERVANHSVPVVAEPTAYVGRITGMVDCKWHGSSSVSLGQKVDLASGLMEITYDTGAKVILQGPVTYQVESNGGYLAVGKLTGRLEKKNDECKMMNDELRTHVSDIHPSSFILHPFSIRTPAATVTDLGTEFGVEVTKNQQNCVHVFQGKVTVRTDESATPAITTPHEIELNAGESASVTPQGAVTRFSGPQAQTTVNTIGFVRRIPKKVIKTLNLVDMVAGGDGFGKARDRGINPNTGEVVMKDAMLQDSKKPSWNLGTSDGRYHRVKGLPFVDGVFVPDDRRGPVQLDSAGHSFAHFGNSDDLVYDYIWAGGKLPAPGAPTPTELRGIDYGAPDHSVLGMISNKGITFDLESIRRANPDGRIVRFRAVTCNSEYHPGHDPPFSVDIWVFVDGQPRFRRKMNDWSVLAIPINVTIGDSDRFLTLVVSDAGDQINDDRVIFGDPHLEVAIYPKTESTAEETVGK